MSIKVPNSALGGRLHDATVIWRTVRESEGAQLGAGGKPKQGTCLPSPQPSELLPRLNSPLEGYLRDAALMQLLGIVSLGELKAWLTQQAGQAAAARDDGVLQPVEEDGQQGDSGQAGATAGAVWPGDRTASSYRWGD